jgi:hypothetical protein
MNGYNDKGDAHGYWEMCYYYGKLHYRGNYYNGKRIGYWEFYDIKRIKMKVFHL